MLKDIQLTQIDVSTFNPPQRTTATALRLLKEDIEKRGILSPVHLIPSDEKYVLVDGHRRHACAKELGIRSLVSVIHHDTKPSQAVELWSALNRSARTVSGAEWFRMWWEAGPRSERFLSKSVRQDIKECEVIFGGRDNMSILVDANISPSISNQIIRVFVLLNSKTSLHPSPSKRKIGEWMIKHKLQGFVRGNFERAGRIPYGVLRKLKDRIERNQPMGLVDLASRNLQSS